MERTRTANDIDPDETLNWADYVDALLHQDTRRNVLVTQSIEGRRRRDQYRDQIEVTKVIHPLAKEG
jgi:pyruvate dehydrogenase complex dehydrogenase (E1) component